MSFGNRTLPMSQYLMSTGEEDISVMRVCEQSDLGVLFTSDFKFGPHIHHIVQKANRLIGLIKKSFEFLDAPMLRTLYISLVRPYLGYACVVWCPFQLGDIRIIEKVQRRATKIIPSLKDKSYHDHLVSLNLPSLLYRRRRMDVIMVYLIVRGLEGISFDRLFTYCDLPTRSNGYKLYKNHCHLNVRKHFFSQRTINDWNSLPRDIIESPNVIIFKSKLDVYWQDYRFKFLDS